MLDVYLITIIVEQNLGTYYMVCVTASQTWRPIGCNNVQGYIFFSFSFHDFFFLLFQQQCFDFLGWTKDGAKLLLLLVSCPPRDCRTVGFAFWNTLWPSGRRLSKAGVGIHHYVTSSSPTSNPPTQLQSASAQLSSIVLYYTVGSMELYGRTRQWRLMPLLLWSYSQCSSIVALWTFSANSP